MKHYLNSDQTMRLKDLGFPAPKAVSKLSLDWDMDTVPTFNYSIGELIEFLPKQVVDEYEVPKGFQLNSCSDSWEVYYSNYTEIEYYKNCTELIDALYDMIIELKEKRVI